LTTIFHLTFSRFFVQLVADDDENELACLLAVYGQPDFSDGDGVNAGIRRLGES